MREITDYGVGESVMGLRGKGGADWVGGSGATESHSPWRMQALATDLALPSKPSIPAAIHSGPAASTPSLTWTPSV